MASEGKATALSSESRTACGSGVDHLLLHFILLLQSVDRGGREAEKPVQLDIVANWKSGSPGSSGLAVHVDLIQGQEAEPAGHEDEHKENSHED